MRGTLRQRKPGYWESRADIGVDPVTKKRRQVSHGFAAGTRREAERLHNRWVASLQERANKATSTGTVGHLLEEWYAQGRADWSPLTADRYRSLIDTHIAPALGAMKLSKVGPADLAQLYRRLGDAGLSPATVRKVHYLLSGAFRLGMDWEWIDRNPAARAKKPVLHRQEVRAPSPEQVLAAIALAQQRYPGYPMYLRLAATTGARRGELVALRLTDVSHDGRTVRIARAVIDHAGELIVKHTKTDDARVVTLDDDTAAMLAGHIDYLRERAAKQGVTLAADAYLFSEPMRSRRLDGSVPWRPREPTRRWRWLRSQAGAADLRLHTLRHFAATQMLDAGVPVRTVSARLGHRQTSTTLNVYSAYIPASDGAAAEAIGRRLLPREEAPAPKP